MESDRGSQVPQYGSFRQIARDQLSQPSPSDLGVFTLTRVTGIPPNYTSAEPFGEQDLQTYFDPSQTEGPLLLLASPILAWAPGPFSRQESPTPQGPETNPKPELELVDAMNLSSQHPGYEHSSKPQKEDGRCTSDFINKLYR